MTTNFDWQKNMETAQQWGETIMQQMQQTWDISRAQTETLVNQTRAYTERVVTTNVELAQEGLKLAQSNMQQWGTLLATMAQMPVANGKGNGKAK